MRILEINVYNYRKGGSEAVYFSTIEMFKEHGDDVQQFALKWHRNLPSPFQNYFPDSKETRHGPFRHVLNLKNYFYNNEAAYKLEKLICKEQPDIAQIHLIWGQITGSILKILKKYRIPTILTIHEYRLVCPAYTFRNGRGEVCEQCIGKYFYKCITNKCCKNSYILSTIMAMEQYFRNAVTMPSKYINGIVYVSKFAKIKLEQYMPSLINIPNIVLYNLSDNIVSINDLQLKRDKYYLFFGRLSYEKGVKTLISAFEETPNCKLKIAGTGPEENALKQYVADKNMRNVEFLGYKTGYELSDLIKKAYYIIVPSEWYENNPMTIIEGYAAGVPVIGAKIGGIPEIIEDGKTGWLFTSGDVKDLVKLIRKSYSINGKTYKKMSANAVNFANNNFNRKDYYFRLIDFFNQLIQKSKK